MLLGISESTSSGRFDTRTAARGAVSTAVPTPRVVSRVAARRRGRGREGGAGGSASSEKRQTVPSFLAPTEMTRAAHAARARKISGADVYLPSVWVWMRSEATSPHTPVRAAFRVTPVTRRKRAHVQRRPLVHARLPCFRVRSEATVARRPRCCLDGRLVRLGGRASPGTRRAQSPALRPNLGGGERARRLRPPPPRPRPRATRELLPRDAPSCHLRGGGGSEPSARRPPGATPSWRSAANGDFSRRSDRGQVARRTAGSA